MISAFHKLDFCRSFFYPLIKQICTKILITLGNTRIQGFTYTGNFFVESLIVLYASPNSLEGSSLFSLIKFRFTPSSPSSFTANQLVSTGKVILRSGYFTEVAQPPNSPRLPSLVLFAMVGHPTPASFPSTTSLTRSLFGGAMTCAIPPNFTDVSLIREIPDNQEVYAEACTDRSLIIELLESTTAAHPATAHFHQLAQDSRATSSTILHSSTPSPTSYPNLFSDDPHFTLSVAYGTQTIAKFRDDDSLANTVNIVLACVALPRADTHLLLVFNDPIHLHPHGNSAQLGVTVANPQQSAPEIRAAVLAEALSTLKIVDWELFC